MFTALHDKIALYKLNRREKQVDDEAKRVLKEAQEKKSHQIYVDWENTYARYEYEDIWWTRQRLLSDSLIREADELHIPRPESDEEGKWERTPSDIIAVGHALTREAMVELRGAIRKEKRERHETVEWWVKIVGSLLTIITGLVGALIGLVSVLRRK